jgi:hypothetical protein
MFIPYSPVKASLSSPPQRRKKFEVWKFAPAAQIYARTGRILFGKDPQIFSDIKKSLLPGGKRFVKRKAVLQRYNQSLVIWKYLSRTDGRQVSWLAWFRAPPSRFLSGLLARHMHTVTRSHRRLTCFPFARRFCGAGTGCP